MTAGLKDNLAWFHTLYLRHLSYFKGLKKKNYQFRGVLISSIISAQEDILVCTKCIINEPRNLNGLRGVQQINISAPSFSPTLTLTLQHSQFKKAASSQGCKRGHEFFEHVVYFVQYLRYYNYCPSGSYLRSGGPINCNLFKHETHFFRCDQISVCMNDKTKQPFTTFSYY